MIKIQICLAVAADLPEHYPHNHALAHFAADIKNGGGQSARPSKK